MSFLNPVKGLFVNGQKVADIEKDSVIEIRPKTVNASVGNGYVNHGVHNSPNSNVVNSFIGNQRIQANSVGAVFGDNANICVNQSKQISVLISQKLLSMALNTPYLILLMMK